MSQITETGIAEFIKTYTKTYIDNPSMMLSAYGQENQTVADYNGRQLLELMQNADDAKSDIIRIQLNTANHTLSIANNGTAFSLEGIESLMYTGLSTKNKAEYIGNKGLGFRSILNWVHQVSILTREVSVRFSKAYSENYFDKNIANNPTVKKRIDKEIAAKKLSPGEKPIAALAFPEIITDREKDHTTKIVLDYKEEEVDKIETQLKVISEEILLFLPNIRSIIIEKDGKQSVEFTKTADDKQQIVINGHQWNIHRSAEELYDAKTKFNYAIAWKDQPENEGLFHNYFPTDVATGLPCIIHATFDLTNNRNQINDTAQNHFILAEIATALGHIADTQLKSNSPDWRCYRFLTPDKHNSQKITTPFFKQIKSIRDSMACYPALDGNYVTKEEAIYQGPAFSDWVEQHGFGHYFPGLLKTIVDEEINITKRYETETFCKAIEALNPELSLEQRVALIGIIANNANKYFEAVHTSETQFPLLLNTKNKIVVSDSKVFTKDTEEANLIFPDYINDIEFISTDMLALIRQHFREEIKAKKLDTESGDSRAIKRFLDPVVNIGLDDITGVILHIISETNKKIKTAEQPKAIIKQMVTSLYSIFLSNPDRRGNLSTIENIPLLSRSETIKNTDKLYFGKEYKIGTDAEIIFAGVRNDDEYLAGHEVFNLQGTEEIISNFFRWLNVNTYTKFETIHKSLGRWEQDGYTQFIFSLQEGQQQDVYKTYKVQSVKELEKTVNNSAFSIEKLIAWIAKDEELLKQLRWANSDEFYTEYNGRKKDIPHKPSYIFYLINHSGITNNVVASLPIDSLGTFKTINPVSPFFVNLNIPEYKIQEIVALLHIKNSFNELHPDQIYQLLENDQKQFEENSQLFYKMLYEYFRFNEKSQLEKYQPDFGTISYFSRKGGTGKEFRLISASEAYYSDNKLLPQQILDNYWFINLPKRIGENRVANFFGVKLIKDLIADIQFTIVQTNTITETLNQYVNQLKPYWLSYRLDALTKDAEKKEAARGLKELRINVVKEATYQLGNDSIFPFKNFDFIPKEHLFVLQYDGETSLEGLKNDAHFCDVIAEIICVTFKVADLKNTYRRIFKDGVKESLHILKSDEKEDTLDNAKKLLGISQEEIHFWQEVFPGKITETDNEEDFTANLVANIGEPLPEYYKNIDFSQLGNKNGITFLKWLSKNISLTIEKLIPANILNSWHTRQLNNCIMDYKGRFEQLLWNKCNASADRKEKENFIKNTNKFDTASENIVAVFSTKNSFILEPDYHGELCTWTKEQFQIDLESGSDQKVEVKTKYCNLLEDYSFGNSVVDMENILKKEKPALHSLMYFEGFEEEVKAECKVQQAALSKEIADRQANEEDLLPVTEAQISKVAAPANKQDTKHGSGSHNSKADRQKAASGKKQEPRVKRSLQNQGYLINPVYEKTDAKHYDLEYKKEGEEEWRFLEVKKDSGGFFFLSKAEKETALAEKNADRYDLAIVSDTGIRIIKSPFLLEDETFENNSKFRTEPTEYKISFKINEE